MRVALITPMKPPDHPVPSGDRTFARLIRAALERAGHRVDLPSELRTWCREPADLGPILERADAEAARIEAEWAAAGAPDAILTYHNYHKAPDLLGPRLARAAGRPYAIVEASRAAKRAASEWGQGFAHADAALATAGALGAVTALDAVALTAFAPAKVVRVPPFIDAAAFRRAGDRDPCALVCAAMMRPGRKAASVAVLAEAYALIRAARPDVGLTVAGDGPERAALEGLFPSGTFVGLLDRGQLADLYARAALFVWPAIDEPFGFTFLEAQAAGLPVVGGRARGVVDVVREGETGLLVPPSDPRALADSALALLADPARRAAMGAAAERFATTNDLRAGAERLHALLQHAAARLRPT